MFPSNTLLSLILVTLSAVGASPLSIDIKPIINLLGAQTVIENDLARVQTMKQLIQLGQPSTTFNVTQTLVSYTAQVGVGDPATNYTLLIDTGSSNTFVGANNKSYIPTKTSIDTGNAVSADYGSGSWSGEEWLDTVTLAPGLVISNQSIGVANSSTGFANGINGILGVGPVDLTNGTVNDTKTVPTVSDNLLSQGKISEEVLGVYFVPSSEPSTTGKLTFGGYDDSVITSPVSYVPLTMTKPSSEYWGINGSISYDGNTILSSTAGFVDTGTVLTLIATDAFEKYQSATGAVMDSATGLLAINSTQYENLKPLTFIAGGMSYDLTPNGQIWPRSLNSDIGGNSSAIYLIVGDTGAPSGNGSDFTLGYTFLERYYSVYDTTNQRVGFASTAYTNAMTN